jgi:hypothetical protein
LKKRLSEKEPIAGPPLVEARKGPIGAGNALIGPFSLLRERMERAAGFEPVTFSLGNGSKIRNIYDFSGLGCSILSNCGE